MDFVCNPGGPKRGVGFLASPDPPVNWPIVSLVNFLLYSLLKRSICAMILHIIIYDGCRHPWVPVFVYPSGWCHVMSWERECFRLASICKAPAFPQVAVYGAGHEEEGRSGHQGQRAWRRRLGSTDAKGEQSFSRESKAVPAGQIPDGRRVVLRESEFITHLTRWFLQSLMQRIWPIQGDSAGMRVPSPCPLPRWRLLVERKPN